MYQILFLKFSLYLLAEYKTKGRIMGNKYKKNIQKTKNYREINKENRLSESQAYNRALWVVENNIATEEQLALTERLIYKTFDMVCSRIPDEQFYIPIRDAFKGLRNSYYVLTHKLMPYFGNSIEYTTDFILTYMESYALDEFNDIWFNFTNVNMEYFVLRLLHNMTKDGVNYSKDELYDIVKDELESRSKKIKFSKDIFVKLCETYIEKGYFIEEYLLNNMDNTYTAMLQKTENFIMKVWFWIENWIDIFIHTPYNECCV